MQWFFDHKKWVKVQADENLALTAYKFVNLLGNEIEFNH